MKASAILRAGIIILLFTVPGFTLAASGDDMKYYASGDPIYIKGEAPGSQSTGLTAWIFGQNYWSSGSISTESDGSYTYEIDRGLTGSLTSGQYFVIIQHPMYNGVFDVTVGRSTPSPGQTSVVSTEGGSFVIDGQGKLQGSAAAYALMNLLDSQNIDDTYTVTTFFLEEPWIRADEIEAWPVGSTIELEGTTNIAPGEHLVYTFSPVSEDIPSSKQSGGTSYTTEMAGKSDVIYGMPYNIWAVDIDTGGMEPGTYMFTIEAVSEGNEIQKYITLYEPVETPEVSGEPTSQEFAGPTDTMATDETTAAAATPQASGSPVLGMVLVLSAVLIAVTGKCLRRREHDSQKNKK